MVQFYIAGAAAQGSTLTKLVYAAQSLHLAEVSVSVFQLFL
jgi:hypothetical protein